MSTVQVQKGSVLDLTAPAGGVVSGKAYLHGGMLAVAQVTAAAGAVYAGMTDHVHELPKEATTAVFVEGEIVYWDNTNFRFDETAVGRFPVGTAIAGAIATDAKVKVKLIGHAVAAV